VIRPKVPSEDFDAKGRDAGRAKLATYEMYSIHPQSGMTAAALPPSQPVLPHKVNREAESMRPNDLKSGNITRSLIRGIGNEEVDPPRQATVLCLRKW